MLLSKLLFTNRTAVAQTMNNLYAMIELLGAVPGLFFALVIGLRKKNHPANIILSFALFVYAAQLFFLFLVRLKNSESYSLMLMVMNAGSMIAWPLFYRYITLLSAPVGMLHKQYGLHIMPLVIYVAGCIIPAALLPQHFKVFYMVAMALTGLVTASYNVAMLFSLLRYRREIQNFFSEIEQLKATWIQINVLLWFVIILEQVIVFTIQSFGVTLSPVVAEIHGLFINLIATAWVYVIGYFAVTHPDIFTKTEKMQAVIESDRRDDEQQLPAEINPIPEQHPENTSMPPAEPREDHYAAMAIEKIEKIMKQEKPYLNDQLTIAMLAARAGIPAYLLGKIINRRLEKNFLTYINEYRINDIKEKLKNSEYKDKTIIEIAYETGFRSKSAFNTFFKKVTGVTPTEFRDSR